MTVTLPIGRTWDGAAVDDVGAVQLAAEGDALVVRVLAPFAADPPPKAPPGPTDRLWEHEVAELFLAGPGDAYLELELGPGGHHLVLRLRGIRRPFESGLPMDVVCHVDGDAWCGRARFPRAWLPDGPHRANAYRIHGPPEGRRYLAHAPVPAERPDFHQPDRFVAIDVPAAPGDPRADAAALLAAVCGTTPEEARAAVARVEATVPAPDPERLALAALRDRRGSGSRSSSATVRASG